MKISKILADINKFDEVCTWLFDVQGDYDAHDMYATGPHNVLNDDMAMMKELFNMAIGAEMLANHRIQLNQIAKRESKEG